MGKRNIMISVILFSILAAILVYVLIEHLKEKSDEARYNMTREFGNEIVACLFKYKEENGVYPNYLKQLVPKYINEIKQPVWGELKWRYFPEDNGQSFVIRVVGPGEMNQTYSPVMGCWYSGIQVTPVE